MSVSGCAKLQNPCKHLAVWEVLHFCSQQMQQLSLQMNWIWLADQSLHRSMDVGRCLWNCFKKYVENALWNLFSVQVVNWVILRGRELEKEKPGPENIFWQFHSCAESWPHALIWAWSWYAGCVAIPLSWILWRHNLLRYAPVILQATSKPNCNDATSEKLN